MKCAVLDPPPLAYAAAPDKNLCALTAVATEGHCITLQINRDMKAGRHTVFLRDVIPQKVESEIAA